MRICSIVLIALFLQSSCSLISFKENDPLTLYPYEDYQILAAGEEIRVRFDEDVEKYTAEQVLSISNANGKRSCRMIWEDSRNLLLEPESPLVSGLLYRLDAKGVYHTAGNKTREIDFSVPFYYMSSEYDPLKVLSLTPGEDNIIDGDSDIIIIFNRPPDEISLLKDLTLSPDTPFDYSLSASELKISPREQWENLSNYTLNISSETKDTNGIPLDPEVERNFRVITGTTVPSIVHAGPAISDYGTGFPFKTIDPMLLEYGDCYRIVFSEDMDRGSIQSAFSLSPALAGDLFWIGDNTLIFVPESGWVMGTDYTLRISKEGESTNGIVLAADYYSYLTPAIETLELNSLECLTGGGFTLNSYSSATSLDLPTELVSPYDITFRLIFSSPFLTDAEKQAVQEHISFYETFSSGGSPRASLYSWTNDLTLTILFSGFNAAADRTHYYIFEVEGGEQGVRNNQGSFMLAPAVQLFRTKL